MGGKPLLNKMYKYERKSFFPEDLTRLGYHLLALKTTDSMRKVHENAPEVPEQGSRFYD
jgi:hypothetical protein